MPSAFPPPLTPTNVTFGDPYQFMLGPQGQIFMVDQAAQGRETIQMFELELQDGMYRASQTRYHPNLASQADDAANWKYFLSANMDLVVVKKANTVSGMTEVHILSSASAYQEFSLQTATCLHETDSSFDFCMLSAGTIGNPIDILIAVKKNNCDTPSTELHVFAPYFSWMTWMPAFQSFGLQTGTAIPQTTDSAQFWLGPSASVAGLELDETAGTWIKAVTMQNPSSLAGDIALPPQAASFASQLQIVGTDPTHPSSTNLIFAMQGSPDYPENWAIGIYDN